MNRFVTRVKQPNKKEAQKRSSPIEKSLDENVVRSAEKSQDPVKTLEEPSLMAKLQHAIRKNDSQFAFDILSKNRPFDNAMNKSMTKLEFAPSYSEPFSEYMLLSVDESVVNGLHEGQSITFRGDFTDDAVICTEDVTFPIKIVESSATVLLLHNCLGAPDSPKLPDFQIETIDGKCFASGELCPIVDSLNASRLKDMLREQELRWDWKEKEDEENMKGYKMSDFLENVQMSVGEIKTALADLPAIKFSNGRYRYLSHKYRGEMLGLIVEMLDEDSIEEVTFESISFEGLRRHLPSNVPDQVIEWFLTSRCKRISEMGAKIVYNLPKANLVRDLTVVILYGTQKMPLHQFKDILAKVLPFGVEVDCSYLDGVADISDAPFGKVITYLSPEDLPDTVKERLLYLFDYRKLWTKEQLRPYFQDIYKSKITFDKYVVDNCEYSISDSNVVYYCGVK